MQNRNGGWSSFDRNNECNLLTHVPFADHNAMIDPATEDLTARVLECLGRFGWPASHPVVERALAFLQKQQTSDGAWRGRWGVNYIYGTSGVLRAFEALGLKALPAGQRAVDWLRCVQNSDGGFGESCASYNDPALIAQGHSTASQTAWGLIGLMSAGQTSESSVTRAAGYLLDQQQPDGSWNEAAFTGTGFPGVFFLKYHLYRNSFPLYALARYHNIQSGSTPFQALRFAPGDFEPGHGNGWGR